MCPPCPAAFLSPRMLFFCCSGLCGSPVSALRGDSELVLFLLSAWGSAQDPPDTSGVSGTDCSSQVRGDFTQLTVAASVISMAYPHPNTCLHRRCVRKVPEFQDSHVVQHSRVSLGSVGHQVPSEGQGAGVRTGCISLSPQESEGPWKRGFLS